MNLGPSRRVSGAELRSLFEGMGLRDAQTFRTSGNVVFDGGGEAPSVLKPRIEAGLAASLGYEVAVFLRSADELLAIAEHEPFPAAVVQASSGKLQVALLDGELDADVREDVLARATGEDRLAFGDRELYWLPSGRMIDSALGMRTIDKLLGSTTMRTKGTIEQLVAKYFAG